MMAFGRMGARGGFGAMGTGGKRAPLRALYTGNVARSTFQPSAQNVTNKQLMSRKAHYASDLILSCQLILPNWFVAATGTESEVASGAPVTFTASIEYPVGTFTQVLFSGLTSAVVANGASVVSDVITVSIPYGARFYSRIYMVTTAGIFWQSIMTSDTANGEALNIGVAGVSDLTMGGTVTNNVNGIFSPVAIIGSTRKPTVVLMGDSRTYGVGDSYSDGAGELGQITRSLAASSAVNYLNLSMSGGRADTWLSQDHSRRVALTNTYGTHIIEAHGINVFDLPGGTPAYEATQLTGIKALFLTLPMYGVTCYPHSTSSDAWATIANQGQGPNPSNRIGWNDNLRSGSYAAAFAGYFEIADVLESARDSGLWNCPVAGGGTANAVLTGDGLHSLQAGCLLIKNSGVINPGVFH